MKKLTYKTFFSALANDTRLAIIEELEAGEKSVSELVDALGCDQSTVSHNLKQLAECEFVISEKRGSFRYYRLNQETIELLLDIIDEHMEKFCPNTCD